jgi:predicted nucleotidyltransferase
MSSRFVYLHSVHEYDAERLGRRLAFVGAALIKLHVAKCHSHRQFVALHDRVALERASELAVIHFVKPLALLRVLKLNKKQGSVSENTFFIVVKL